MREALLLLPGLNNTAAVFDGTVAALPQGINARAVNLPALDTVEALADHVLACAPGRFWLAGFSFGGYVAMAVLERAPDRVIGVALICSLPGADTPAHIARRHVAIEAARQGRYESEAVKVLTPFHPDSLQRSDLLARREAMIREYGAARHIAHCLACIARPDRTSLLDGRHPLLLVTASDDVVVPSPAILALGAGLSGAPEGTRAAPDAGVRSVCIQQAGHLLPMEQPRALATVLADWIESARPRPM